MTGARRKLLSVAMLVVVAALGTWYVRGHIDDFRKVLEIELGSFLALSGLVLVAIWIMGMTINALMGIFDTRLRGWEAFGLAAANTMANFYFTKAGLAAKGLYLKHRHNFPYTHYVSTVAGAYVISFVTFGVLGLFCLALKPALYRVEFLGVFAALIAGGLLPLAVPGLHKVLHRVLPARIQSVVTGWEKIRTHRRALALLAVLNALYVVVGGFRLFVAYTALGYSVDWFSCVVISTLQTVTVVVTLTPGGVGIRQALVGYGSRLLDIGAAEGVVASTLDHAVGTLWVFVVGIVFTNWIWVRQVRDRKREPAE